MTTSVKGYMRFDPEAHGGEERRKTWIVALSSVLVLVGIVSVVGVTVFKNVNVNGVHRHEWQLVRSVCSETRYPAMCLSSLLTHPWSQDAQPGDLLGMALKATMDRSREAHALASTLASYANLNERERSAWQDCLELFEDTMFHLNASFSAISGFISLESIDNKQVEDVRSWLSAALTNQDTCLNGFQESEPPSNFETLMSSVTSDASKLISISLAITSGLLQRPMPSSSSPVENRDDFISKYVVPVEEDGFPRWLSTGDRSLLQSSGPNGQENAVVAKDGSGTYKTIAAAINAAPRKSKQRHVIYVKAGIYKENVDIPKDLTNLMIRGDGKDRTVVTGNKNVVDGSTTFNSATFAVSGSGFIAKDITFENTAGPEKHQAVALRVGADLSVLYRCSFKGYQDTLYVYSLRQFYREVDVYGTVDFIFGNSAVVFQNSNMFARKPMSQQKNIVTAQGRTDPNQNTGISIHNCKVTAASDLQPVQRSFKTYLGRPWKEYSRTVYLQSTLDGLIDPAGWLEWDGSFALKTLYYGEYQNSGAGAGTAKRVNWPGFHVITSSREASKFTVGQFISGDSWIPATGVSYTSGLIE